jgi:hypothetical protein
VERDIDSLGGIGVTFSDIAAVPDQVLAQLLVDELSDLGPIVATCTSGSLSRLASLKAVHDAIAERLKSESASQ